MKTNLRFRNNWLNSAAGWVCLILVSCSPLAWSNPTGPVVIDGSAHFQQNGSHLIVTQGTDRAVIDWQSFSISANEITQFIQPGQTSAVLNRVRGASPSVINGQLLANGRVFLLNSNGILIGRSGVIDTAGFVASTLDVSNDEFMAGGDLHFHGNSNASVVNLGTIKASAGDVILIGATVRNDGTILAPRGTAGLAAGQDVILMATGDERIKVRTGKGQVINQGVIDANIAELKAHHGNVGALAIRNDGRVAATGITKKGGRIMLSAGGRGSIKNSGSIKASSKTTSKPSVKIDAGAGDVEAGGEIDASSSSGMGGAIIITGNQINIPTGSLILADGETGGGSINIGGGLRGLNPDIANAKQVSVGSGAQISVDAIGSGNGGTAVLFADDTLNFSGSISSIGGRLSGNGGLIELSGKSTLYIDNLSGQVKLSSLNGLAGTLLLDPVDISVTDGIGGGVFGTTITDDAINQFLQNSGNLAITTSGLGENPGNLKIDDTVSINWTSGNALTLAVVNDFINEGTIDGTGAVTILTGGQVVMEDFIRSTGGVTINGMNIGDGVSMKVDTANDVIDGSTSSSTQLLLEPGKDGLISLREAILASNNDSLFNDIGFASSLDGNPLTITLNEAEIPSTAGDFDIASGSQIRLSGNGIDQTIIQGGATAGDAFSRIFQVNSGGTLELDSLTVQNGTATGGNGGLINNEGTLRITKSLLSGNVDTDFGGAIYSTGSLFLNNSTITGTLADLGGGAIAINGGTGTISRSTIYGNSTNGDGGAILLYDQGGEPFITILSNRIARFGPEGPALLENGGPATTSLSITNSTLSGNSATANGGGLFVGANMSARVINSTITLNQGGGVYLEDFGSLAIYNNILAGNLSGSDINADAEGELGSVSVADSSHNLIGSIGTIGGLFGGQNIIRNSISINAILDPVLADNGGSTMTHALVNNSPAIDAGNNSIINGTDGSLVSLLTDQRFADRFANGITDIGAFEKEEDDTTPDLGDRPREVVNTVDDTSRPDRPGGMTPPQVGPPGGGPVVDNFVDSGGPPTVPPGGVTPSELMNQNQRGPDGPGPGNFGAGPGANPNAPPGSPPTGPPPVAGGSGPPVIGPPPTSVTPSNGPGISGPTSIGGGPPPSPQTKTAIGMSLDPRSGSSMNSAMGGDGTTPVKPGDGPAPVDPASPGKPAPGTESRLGDATGNHAQSELSGALGGDGSFPVPAGSPSTGMNFAGPPPPPATQKVLNDANSPKAASTMSRAMGEDGTAPVNSGDGTQGVAPGTPPGQGTQEVLNSNLSDDAKTELIGAMAGSP